MTIDWVQRSIPKIDSQARLAASNRQASLTSPTGALYALGRVSVDFAGWQSVDLPQCQRIVWRSFHSDSNAHTAAAYGGAKASTNGRHQASGRHPESTEAILLSNIETVVAKRLGADFAVVAPAPNSNCAQPVPGPAVNLAVGQQQLASTHDSNCRAQLFIADSHGHTDRLAATQILAKPHSIAQNPDNSESIHQLLETVGTPGITAIVGAYIRAAQLGIPILVSGEVSISAALLAIKVNAKVRDWMMFAHRSSEASAALASIDAEPLLQSDLHVEGYHNTASAVAVIRSTLGLNQRMQPLSSATTLTH